MGQYWLVKTKPYKLSDLPELLSKTWNFKKEIYLTEFFSD